MCCSNPPRAISRLLRSTRPQSAFKQVRQFRRFLQNPSSSLLASFPSRRRTITCNALRLLRLPSSFTEDAQSGSSGHHPERSSLLTSKAVCNILSPRSVFQSAIQSCNHPCWMLGCRTPDELTSAKLTLPESGASSCTCMQWTASSAKSQHRYAPRPTRSGPL